MFKWLNIISTFKFYWLLNFLHCGNVVTNASIWQVLVAIECEEVVNLYFLFQRPFICFLKDKRQQTSTRYVFWRILVLSLNLANFAKEKFFGSHKN